MKVLKWALAAIVLMLAGVSSYVYTQLRDMQVEQLSADLFVIRGIGGNVTVVRTSMGSVVIDSMTFPMQGRLIRQQVENLTGSDPVMVINTHYHLDHTHGNPGFAPGTRVITTERTASHLQYFDADFWESPDDLAPTETFSDSKKVQVGDKTLQLIHPGRAHTDGDLVVIIEQESTIVMGDLLFNQHYPNIDLEAGGSVQQWSETLDTVLQYSFERVIPGHGATTDRVGIHEFQRFMGQLAKIGRAAAADGQSLEQVLAGNSLTSDKGFTELQFAGIPIGLDRAFVLRRAWEESTGNFKQLNQPLN
ncbi:MAG: MBL fold metallo-hydrolase [Gammaproteobacteria bacterium]|nr:MBL fold metallo-hydrolase [Gammaproteobacteria bacterium]